MIYADFEPLLEKTDKKHSANTKLIHEHKPTSYGILVLAVGDVSSDLFDELEIPTISIIYHGTNEEPKVVMHFVETIVIISKRVEELLKTIK